MPPVQHVCEYLHKNTEMQVVVVELIAVWAEIVAGVY